MRPVAADIAYAKACLYAAAGQFEVGHPRAATEDLLRALIMVAVTYLDSKGASAPATEGAA